MRFAIPLTLIFIIVVILYFLSSWFIFERGFQKMDYQNHVNEIFYYDESNCHYYINGLE